MASSTPPTEITELQALVAQQPPGLAHEVVGMARWADAEQPLHVFTLGNPSPAVPAAGFFGGVHGLERIGAEVVIAYLKSLLSRLRWDDSLKDLLKRVRLVFMPLVNPGGLVLGTRANPNGVDLMRNAPVEATSPVPWMVGGQRRGPRWPWYRGADGAPMEVESAALCEVVERELLSRPVALAVDCHSGFGLADRIWFPYAHTAAPIPDLAELHALTAIFDATYLHHRYIVEPQSRQYLTHGDLWDHLYLRAQALPSQPLFLPLTLEMGSWLWVKKNPRQVFSRHGMFNPLIEHRRHRVLRRHIHWLDFVARAAASAERWRPRGDAREFHERAALERWYGAGLRA